MPIISVVIFSLFVSFISVSMAKSLSQSLIETRDDFDPILTKPIINSAQNFPVSNSQPQTNTDDPVDIIAVGSAPKGCIGDGNGNFACDWINLYFGGFGVDLGDLNHDGLLDFVLARGNYFTGPQPNALCMGAGDSSFNCEFIDNVVYEESSAVVLGDLNNDGNLDAVFANYDSNSASGGPDKACIGDGNGGFSCNLIGPTFPSEDVALGDINNDGNLDVVFATFLGGSPICLGNGDGSFICQSANDANFEGHKVALGDVNNDNNLDAVFADSFGNSVCIGDGLGAFSCSTGSLGNSNYAVALGDMNEDGNLDAVFSTNFTYLNRICLGSGTGAFTCTSYTTAWAKYYIELADVNNDGHLDVVSNSVFLGDGTGEVETTINPYAGIGGYDVAIGSVFPSEDVTLNSFLYLPLIIKNN